MTYGIRDTNPMPVAGQVQWDQAVNAKLQAHDDTLAQRVTVDGINVNGTIDAQGNAVINVSNVRFFIGGDPGVANSVFISSGDLWVRDGSNRLVQLTSGGSVNVAGSGGFGGDYVSSNQNGASFTNATGTFTFTVSGGTSYATLEHGSVLVHNGSSTGYVGIAAPSTIGSTQYTLTMPAALVGGPALVRVDATGTVQFAQSASFTESYDASRGVVASTVGTITYDSTNGWSLGTGGGTIDIEVPYTFGDTITAVGVGRFTGFPLSASLIFRDNSGSLATIARASWNDNVSGMKFLQAGTPTMTGTFPYTPPGTGSLSLLVGTTNAISFKPIQVTRIRKIIS